MGPLSGFKVVEMPSIGPVPYAGMLLADMGADVVVLERDNNFLSSDKDINRRGKRALNLDLKSENGLNLAKSLVNAADIVLEGFRPGVMERLGLGPDEFNESNPKLIYGRMTGWGQTGPLAQTAGHDINYISLTGALHAMGTGDQPPTPPLNLVGDYGGGSLFLVMGVLAAVIERQNSGQGQVVDAAITDGTASLMSVIHSLSSIGQWSPRRESNLLDGGAYFYNSYATSDDKYVSIAALEPQFYAMLREHAGLDSDEFDKQFDPSKWPELKSKLTEIFKHKTRDEWCALLEGTDVCFAPVLDYTEAPDHHHMKARNTYINVDGITQPAPAPRFSRTQSEVKHAFKRNDDDENMIKTNWGIA